MGDKGQHEIRERVWVEKFDHDADEPVLVETKFFERIRKVPAEPDDTPETT